MERPQTYAAGQVKSTTKIGGSHALQLSGPLNAEHDQKTIFNRLDAGLRRVLHDVADELDCDPAPVPLGIRRAMSRGLRPDPPVRAA